MARFSVTIVAAYWKSKEGNIYSDLNVLKGKINFHLMSMLVL